MTYPSTGPCSTWATTADLCSPCDDYLIDAALMEDLLLTSSEILYELSAKQFPGECETTIRPCTRRSWDTIWAKTSIQFAPYRLFGAVACGCDSFDNCGCGNGDSLRLPQVPVSEVSQVKVDGEVLATDLYRVDDNQYLVRLNDSDGTNPGWPCCQDLTLPDTADDTFSVTYTYGRNPPSLGVRAAAILACELYMACDSEAFENHCRLPRNIVQVARQGVTVLVNNAGDLFTNRYGQPTKFGIWEIDLFLRTYNPNGLMSRSIVLSPDLPPRGKRIDT